MTIKLVVSDVDGTIVQPDKSVSAGTVAAAARLQAAGVKLAIVSARPPRGMAYITETLKLQAPYAGFNGGLLIGPDGAEVEWNPAPAELVQKALDLFEARGIDAWIVGQTDKTPDFAHDLSYGWGVEQEVIDALGRLRALNARRPAARRIHFYGMDMPANGGGSLMPALEPVWAYLAQVDRGASDRSRAALAPIAQRVASNGYDIVAKYQALGPACDTLRRELDALAAGLDANRRAYVARSSPSRYAWAARLAEVARQTERAVRIGWNDASNPRDVAMAANVEWILAREGARGKVVVWAHNLHVARAPITGPIFASRGGAPAVTSMGERLQHSLGAGYVPIGTAFARSMADSSALDSSSVDAALAMVGVPRFLLALDPAPSDAPAAAWVRAAHLKRAEDGYVVTKLVPAFDAVMFIDTVRASRHVAAP